MQTVPVIQASRLTRHFGETVALDGLSLEIYPGEIFGLLGHNGAGKTTTIRLFNGVLEPSAGTVQVLGLSPLEDGPALRRRTGVLTENPSLDERLSARENLRFYAELYDVPTAEVEGRIEELLVSFDLSERADEKVSSYSKGMKQRLALARAFLHRPELIFLDEPTAGLDPIAAHHVHHQITHLSQQEQRTILICTHNLIEAQRLCDRVAVLEQGHLLALGTPAELARQLGRNLQLEIEVASEQVSLAMEMLRAAKDVSEVSRNRDVVSVAGVSREVIPQLLAMLVNVGIRVYRVTPSEPSLEDVYFALHGEEGGLS